MALNDELLGLHEKIRYYTYETFKNIPSEPGVYCWFYPLNIRNGELKEFLDEINIIFNFNYDDREKGNSRTEFSMGWRKYSLATEYKNISSSEPFLKKWSTLYIEAALSGDTKDLEGLKKILFISSIFMPPLYIGKAFDLSTRCQQHIIGTTEKDNNFHNRYKNYTKLHKTSYRNVEELIFACISTKQFNLDDKKYEDLIEKMLMKLVKPIYSIK